MKRMKRIASILLAVVMTLGMTMTALAADNKPWTITVKQNEKDQATHTYDAYQIFAGDLLDSNPVSGGDVSVSGGDAVKNDLVLSNIEWGSGVNGDALLAALTTNNIVSDGDAAKPNPFANCTSAADVAAVLGANGNNAKLLDAFAKIVGEHLTTNFKTASGKGDVKIPVTGSGYYFVKDREGSVSGGDASANGAYTRFLLQVIGDNTVIVKSEVPTGDKKVYVVPANGAVSGGDAVSGGNAAGNGATADANYGNIGSHVSYEITSKVPDYTGYDYYFFIMNDTLSEGLEFDGASSVKVTVGNATLAQGTDYRVYTGEDAGKYTFRLAFADIKEYEIGEDITVTYSATVTDKAVIGNTGNPNTWNLQYSNNPNVDYNGKKDTNNPGLPLDEENTPLGQTPDEKTLTFLTELDITKYKDAIAGGNELSGAEFTLTGTSYQVVLTNVVYYEKAENGTHYLLKDGTYTTDVPTGTEYVEIGVGTENTTTGYILDENDNYVVPTDKTQYKGKTLYKLVRGTNTNYVDVNTKYVERTKTETTTVPVNVSMELTTGADGKIQFKGLGAGTYTLTETVTPAGYNTLEPIEFTISVTVPDEVKDGTEKCEWNITWGDAENNGNGVFAANVINVSGTLLPSTGGIGTTIFYVVGSILVLAAVVLLIAKKRMSAEK